MRLTQHYYNIFMTSTPIKCLIEATSFIEDLYMSIPMASDQCRCLERVYAYELYHQLRIRWDDSNYSWNGEITKSGHTHFNHPGFKKSPDLLLHRPGYHSGNLLIIEIKMAQSITRKGLHKDLRTLTAFRRGINEFRGYEEAVFLLVGGNQDDIKKVLREAATFEDVDTNLIMFYWHQAPKDRAHLIRWLKD